jgi:cytochrome c biogenesis protein CcdA
MEEPQSNRAAQEEARRRETRIMLGTMLGFLAGMVFTFSCCGRLALLIFFAFYIPEDGEEYFRLGGGIAFVAFTTWAGRAIANRAEKQSQRGEP